LPLLSDRSFHKAPSKEDSVFPLAVADTEPDGWGRRVIARARAKQRSAKRAQGGESVTSALSEVDYLLGVDDISRVGALRFKRTGKTFERAPEPGERGTPPLLEIRQIIDASHALERGTETAQDLRYLRGKGTSLGGMRPKCSLFDDDGSLAIGKFPSIVDDRAVTKGEVLALRLAASAGVNAARARTVYSDGLPVTIVRRFDRVEGNRLPYASAATMLQAARGDDRSYTEIADQTRSPAGVSSRVRRKWTCQTQKPGCSRPPSSTRAVTKPSAY
jgi:serine/threonine-protein kinase HipA